MIRIDRNTVELTQSERIISRHMEHCLDAGMGCAQARDAAIAYVGVPRDKLDPEFYEWLV